MDIIPTIMMVSDYIYTILRTTSYGFLCTYPVFFKLLMDGIQMGPNLVFYCWEDFERVREMRPNLLGYFWKVDLYYYTLNPALFAKSQMLV